LILLPRADARDYAGERAFAIAMLPHYLIVTPLLLHAAFATPLPIAFDIDFRRQYFAG
jgi:hypothetical protein